MPQHKSAAKRVRQNAKRRAHNRFQKSRLRTMIKQVRTADDKAQAETLLNETKAYLDRLATKGVLHQNKAAHYKSQLDKHVAGLA